ncbi:MAG: DUF7336 domain-containing protein [Paraclostridium sp.]
MVQVYIVIGYNSYGSWDTLDEVQILGVFYTKEKADKYIEEYLSNKHREYEKAFTESYFIN